MVNFTGSLITKRCKVWKKYQYLIKPWENESHTQSKPLKIVIKVFLFKRNHIHASENFCIMNFFLAFQPLEFSDRWKDSACFLGAVVKVYWQGWRDHSILRQDPGGEQAAGGQRTNPTLQAVASAACSHSVTI